MVVLNGFKMTPEKAYMRLRAWAEDDGLHLRKYNAGGGNNYKFFGYPADDYFSSNPLHTSDSISEMEAFWRGWQAAMENTANSAESEHGCERTGC